MMAYGMRNAGDLTPASDLHPTFLGDGKSAHQEPGLPLSTAAFSLTVKELEKRYFALLDGIVSELRDSSRCTFMSLRSRSRHTLIMPQPPRAEYACTTCSVSLTVTL